MRRGFDGLARQVQEVLGQDPFSGHLFVFSGRRGDLLKCLVWDTQGLVLYAKRLERGRFTWPQATLAVVDDHTRECLGLVVDTSLSGVRVSRELDRIIALRGHRPAMTVSDNGTELTSRAILRWQEDRLVLWHSHLIGQNS